MNSRPQVSVSLPLPRMGPPLEPARPAPQGLAAESPAHQPKTLGEAADDKEGG